MSYTRYRKPIERWNKTRLVNSRNYVVTLKKNCFKIRKKHNHKFLDLRLWSSFLGIDSNKVERDRYQSLRNTLSPKSDRTNNG